jgi:hypothetical protein
VTANGRPWKAPFQPGRLDSPWMPNICAEASLLPVELIVRASCGVVGPPNRSPAWAVQVR